MAVGCFVSTGRSLEKAVERVRLAEDLGYEAVYVTQIAGRDAFTVLAAYALGTERIRVGTGVMPIYARTPATTAQTAATLDELSGGRPARSPTASCSGCATPTTFATWSCPRCGPGARRRASRWTASTSCPRSRRR